MNNMNNMKNKYLLTIALFLSLFLFGCQKQLSSNNTKSGQIINEAKRAYKKQDYTKAHLLLMPLARKKNPIAQYEIGYLYYYGLGTSIDYPKARMWIRRSASQGYQPAIKALDILAEN